MSTSVITRVRLKLKRIVRELDPLEREWPKIWPLIDSVEGFLDHEEAHWLFKSAGHLPDGSNLVEIGSFKGRSTSCLAFGCRGSQKRVYAIDPFDGGPDLPLYDSFGDFTRNMERCGVLKCVEPIVGTSTEVARTWHRPIHFLFIDGSHRYEDVLADFTGFFPHLVPNAVVAFHDVCEAWPGVLRAWDEVIKHELKEVGYCKGLGYGRKAQRV